MKSQRFEVLNWSWWNTLMQKLMKHILPFINIISYFPKLKFDFVLGRSWRNWIQHQDSHYLCMGFFWHQLGEAVNKSGQFISLQGFVGATYLFSFLLMFNLRARAIYLKIEFRFPSWCYYLNAITPFCYKKNVPLYEQ